MKNQRRFPALLALVTLGMALCASSASADEVLVGISPEAGDATYAWVPQHVPSDEVILVMVDRSGPVAEGVVLLTGGRSMRIGGVESRPFAVTMAYEPAAELVAVR
jgi:hypothetical protein